MNEAEERPTTTTTTTVSHEHGTVSISMGPEMDLVNRPNPWLPAYGFQLQHHQQSAPPSYQPTHEDLRVNETMVMQQVDFLETILEETSDDLQSDSDRSGTTYWLGSDSETESVIHIKAGQRTADEKHDGSGSDSNLIPKKRRRRNGSETDGLGTNGGGSSSRDDSSASSRSSSLLQFESLERTCATLSPSSYSFDSLEYNNGRIARTGINGSTARHEPCPASPDSLEQDYAQFNGGGYLPELPREADGLYGRLRPYRSFESLGERDLMPREQNLGGMLANGFASHAFGKNCDLSMVARRPRSRRRDPWQQLHDSDYEEHPNDSSSPDNLSEPDTSALLDNGFGAAPRYNEVDQLLVFGDAGNGYGQHTASLDCRNSVDLRDFGLDDSDDERARRESTLLDLKAAARLNIPTRRSHRRQARDRSNEDVGSTTSSTSFDEDEEEEEEEEDEEEEEEEYLSDIDPSVQLRRPRHHHHHHHHHHRSSSGSCSGGGGASLQSQHQYAGADTRQSGSSSCCVGASSGGGSGGFNFRFAADKWRSAPSLPGSLLESARSLLAAGGSCSDYTRVASVPVDLDLCGGGSSALLLKTEEEEDDDYREATLKVASSEERTLSAHDEEERLRDIEMMTEVVMNHDGGEVMPEDDLEPGKIVGEEKARMRKRAKEMMMSQEVGRASDVLADVNSDMVTFIDEENQNVLEEKPVMNSTVKTQDRVESTVMEIAMAMENDPDAVVDEAIRHLQREVEEAASKNSANVEELTAALENAQRMKQTIMENNLERRRVKNNASYELAQQNTVDEACVRPPRRRRHVSKEESTSSTSPPGSTRQRRVLNNASYELAQQNDVMKNLSFGFGKQFQRMDACEELIEPASGGNSTLKLSELVEEMRGSTSNLESVTRERVPDVRTYSKSTENVSARAGGSRKRAEQPPPEEPQTLLDQIKKNSDFFSTSGENAGNGRVPAVSSPCVPSALDDEVDYPCLLENKPIIAARRSATENTLQLLSDGKTNNYVDDNEEEEEVVVKLVDNVDEEAYIKKSFIGEYYPDTLSPTRNYPHAMVSKSCENVTSSSSISSNGSSSNNNNVPGERLWRVVVEKQRVEKENGNGTSATAAARVTAASSPLLYEPAAAAASAGESAGWLSSPASAADVRRGEAASPTLDTNNSSTLPSTRASEMSATAAKRLAMSGTAASSTTSINNASTASNIINNNKEERKKGGLGGFLQRFSKLRFSGRSKVPRSEVQKKSANNNSGAGENVTGRVQVVQQAGQLRKKNNEPDYIIIPLHPPSDEVEREKERTMLQQRQEQDALAAGPDVERSASNVSANGRPPVCSGKKPPLPPQSLRTSSSSSTTAATPALGSTGVGVPTSGPSRRRAATDLGNPAAIEMAKARAAMLAQEQQQQQPRRGNELLHHQYHHHRPAGLLETDLDAPDEEAAAKKARSLLNLNHNGHHHHHHHLDSHHHHHHHRQPPHLSLSIARGGGGYDDYDDDYDAGCELDHEEDDDGSLCCQQRGGGAANGQSRQQQQHLNHHHHRANAACEAAAAAAAAAQAAGQHQRPHKSMEFLLDKENLHFVKPPENELQKVGERVPSEHELRVQRSLQRLNVPDWYKNSPAARDGGGFRLKRHSDASQHGGWRALGSKTTSLSSLSSSSNRQPTTGTLLSPSPTPPVFSRWSTSLLNSAGSSPASSARSSFNHRQPYLGWRSQERLANPRTPAERLAQGILPQLQNANKSAQQPQSPQQPTQPQSAQQSPSSGHHHHHHHQPVSATSSSHPSGTNQEVRNSIKEVTSAIVHYVQSGQEVGGGSGRLSPRPDNWEDRGGARSTSPRGSTRLIWMESSFVGVRPVESPDAPTSIAVPATPSRQPSPSRSSLLEATTLTTITTTTFRSGGETTSEDGGSTPGVCPHGDGDAASGFMSLSGGSTTTTIDAPGSLYLDLVQSPDQQSQQSQQLSQYSLPQDSRHRQRRHRRSENERRESPSPTLLPEKHHHQSRQRHRGEEQHHHRQHQQQMSPQQQQPHQRAVSASATDVPQRVSDTSQQPLPHQQRSRPPLQRRASEGSDSVPARSSSRGPSAQRQHHHHHHHQQRHGSRQRRVSFDSAGSLENVAANREDRIVRCRNSKCVNSATLAEARKTFKSCHNCTCLYCSRECRRAHWQRHRRTCLYSRASSLCIQVLSSVKKDPTTLKHVSILAKRGFAAHGRGAVKCFFASPEAAEKFIAAGFLELGEPTYVRWSDILPSEMGAELYAEAVRLCESYNPETRLVLYVSVCVVREVPSSSGGAVMWERQPVSRCAKLRLDASCRQEKSAPGTAIATPATNTSSSASAITSPQQTRAQLNTSPCNITREMESPETLVLASYPLEDGSRTPKETRELGLENIQKQLKQRGVSLRRHFPQVYGRLCAYVDGSVEKFAPVTIYPRDQASGRSFMCIIMLDAEPERLQLLPTDSSRVRTVDVNLEIE